MPLQGFVQILMISYGSRTQYIPTGPTGVHCPKASSDQKGHTEVTDKGSKAEAMQAGTVQSTSYRQLRAVNSCGASGDVLGV